MRRPIILSIALFLLWMLPLPVLAADETTGTKLFEIHCAGCHVHGSNIIRRGKNLKLNALQRNHVDTVDAIAALVIAGKNNMPAYGDRLSSSDITAVSRYVLEQAQSGWKSE